MVKENHHEETCASGALSLSMVCPPTLTRLAWWTKANPSHSEKRPVPKGGIVMDYKNYLNRSILVII